MARIQNLVHAQALLDAFIPTSKSMHYTLERMRALMAYLGNPQDSLKVVHVAGTSGKTSTSYYAAALLVGSGFRVGLSVSPHIDSVTERAQINLQPLSEKLYCDELGIFLDLVAESKLKPSYFELLVAFSYWLFERQNVEYAVMEVGLGGLLDATNVVQREHKICIITDIGLDHTEILGSTLAEIAAQKAGIIHEGNQVFMHSQDSETMAAVEAAAHARHAQLNIIGVDDRLSRSSLFGSLPEFQQRNLSLAYGALKPLLRESMDIEKVFELSVPARMEEVSWQGKTIVLDGSHNEQKLAALVEAMKKKYSDKSIILLICFGENKTASLENNLRLLRQLSEHIVITKFHIGQDELRTSIEPEFIAGEGQELGFTTVVRHDPQDAFEYAIAQKEQVVLVTGSFYLLNHIRPLVSAHSIDGQAI
jgi:dihydrofolate synthase/folylpolyglutamate synthase